MTIKYIGTLTEKIELASAKEVYRLAVRDLGRDLGGSSLTDLLADNFEWPLSKCQQIAQMLSSGTVGEYFRQELRAGHQIRDGGCPLHTPVGISCHEAIDAAARLIHHHIVAWGEDHRRGDVNDIHRITKAIVEIYING